MRNARTSPIVIASLAGVIGLIILAVILLGNKRSAPAPAAKAVASSAPTESAPEAIPASVSSAAEARRARDAMRDRILAALRKQAATARPAPTESARRAVAARPEGDLPPGRYEPTYIQQVFREEMFPLLRTCYEGALTRRPKLAGKLVLTFKIIGDPSVGGVVEDAGFADESTLKDEEMETCVRESTMTLTFDKPMTGGGEVTVKYPVDFAPGDDDENSDAAPARGADGGPADHR